MAVSLAFHIVGMIMWVGALLIMTRMLRGFAENPSSTFGDQGLPLRAVIKRTWVGFGLGGMGLSLISGTFQLLNRGMSFYMSQGWFHGKLTFIVILLVVTLIVHRNVLSVANGGGVTRKTIGMLHGLSGLSFILIVFLTILGRGAGL